MTAARNQAAIIEEILRQQREEQGSPYQHLKKTVGSIGKTGRNMATVGDYMKNNLSNPTLQKLGSNISSVGSKLSNGANTVNNVITPQNYFKGFAPRPFASLNGTTTGMASGLGAGTGSTLGSSAVGNAIGSEVAGTGSALGSSAIGNAIGAEVGGTAAGAGAGSAVGSAIGSEVGGAAAGGSAAGAGAAAGPIGALVALGVMAATGANRKRAKKSGQALLSAMNKESEAALNQTNEMASNMQQKDYSQPMLEQPNNKNVPMQGANVYNNQFQGFSNPERSTIYGNVLDNYFEENPIKNVLNGDATENSPNIHNLLSPNISTDNHQTDNTTPLAAEVSQEENIKRGLMDKFLSGISDFLRGYQENRNNGFNPNNLTADKFTETVVNPADTQKITDYQNQLENDENYNNWVNRAGVDKAEALKAIAEGKNSGNSDVDNWIKNNPDAYNETTT